MKRTTMSELERAVYDLAEAGALDAAHAVLYPRPIGKLVRAGLIERTEVMAEDGRPVTVFRAVRAPTDTRPPRSLTPASVAPVAIARTIPAPPPPVSTPAPDPMGTLVCRVPQAWIDTLDAMGFESRSEAARIMLGKALASGSGARLRKTGA